ncbi:MAG: TGS domain-containing protein, partial [Nitrososphaeria archaeon]|nr:TGS domain-containing protein [Nitrososphaeria archaeon]
SLREAELLLEQKEYDKCLAKIDEVLALDPAHAQATELKAKAERAKELARELEERSGLRVVPASVDDPRSIEVLKEEVFGALTLVRVYTQKDGVISNRPILLPEGSTVIELAELIHKDLARGFKYARVWGRSVKVQGQRVGPDHVLSDGDVVEIKAG